MRASRDPSYTVENERLTEALAEIAALLSLSREERFKAEAYARGAQIVAGLSSQLGELVETARLTEIEGIGPSLATQITELHRTGCSPLLERLRAAYPPGAAELSRLPGMTLRRIRALSEGLGISSLEALREACQAERVRSLPGFGAKTEQRLLAALEERAQATAGPRPLLLAEARALAARIEAQLLEEQIAEAVLPAGALRRGEELLDELSLVVIGARERVLPRVGSLPSVVRVDPSGERALLALGVPLVLHIVERASAGARLLHATGPDAHVAALAAHAEARGLSLDAEALSTPLGERLEASACEPSIYRVLELPYVPPELRNGAHDSRESYEDLVDLADIVGMVHCHTTHSDGKATVEEMARAAEALGMQYITITDHSPSAHYARGVTLDRLERQWDDIARAQERVGIRILRGTESDILADGSLDYPDAVLERFDVVIASIHARFRMTRAEMTARLVRAMEQPLFKIWGHALGRLLLKRDPIDCDVERVLDALAASRGAVEINGDPHRLDLAPAWLPLARARNIPFVLSVDAHSTAGMSALPLAVTMARRGGLRRREVLNALPTEAFLTRVRS